MSSFLTATHFCQKCFLRSCQNFSSTFIPAVAWRTTTTAATAAITATTTATAAAATAAADSQLEKESL